MNKLIYCLFDKKSGFYNNELILLDNSSVATRWLSCFLSSAVEHNPNSPLSMYPEDFDLYCVGTFDSLDCITSVFDKPSFVVNAGSLLNLKSEV